MAREFTDAAALCLRSFVYGLVAGAYGLARDTGSSNQARRLTPARCACNAPFATAQHGRMTLNRLASNQHSVLSWVPGQTLAFAERHVCSTRPFLALGSHGDTVVLP